MPTTKQHIAAARKVYETYWESYTKGDLEAFISTLDETYEMIGTSEKEICHTKADGIAFIKAQIAEIVGKAELRNRQIDILPMDQLMLVNEHSDIYVLADSTWNFYSKIRISTLLRETETGWKVFQQHGSLPDIRVQEGETMAIEKINRENIELRDAVKRRTAELEHKNWELEIEAALERVRTMAMGMKKPDDLLDVCRIISEQLNLLKIGNIRNVQVAIIDEPKKIYANYQYFAAYAKSVYEETGYENNPASYDMVTEMQRSANSFFIGSIKEDELQKFRDWRKRYDQFPDPILDDLTEVFYYFYSIGQGGLGLTTYQAINENELEIFKRFHLVFKLAYRRFMDIQLAEAQAREAQIDAAIARVRAQSMAMYCTDDIIHVNKEMIDQLKYLQVDGLTGASIYLVDEDDMVKVWDISSPGSISIPGSYTFSYDAKKYPVLGGWVETWRTSNQDYLVLDFPKETLLEAVEEFKELLPEMAGHFKNAIESGKLTHQWNPAGRLSAGMLSIDLTIPPTEDTKNIVTKMAAAFNLAYTRFLDLQKAEAQAREAQIEASLERVRASTMAMQASEDLSKVASVMFGQMKQLGGDLFAFGIVLCNKDKDTVEQWHNLGNEGMLSPFSVPVDLDYIHRYRYEQWKAGEKLFSIEIPEDYIAEHSELMFELPSVKATMDEVAAQGIEVEVPEWEIDYGASFKHGYLLVSSRKPFQENHIFPQFAKVFDQAYTRFLDLQKAEAQAREAKIETALEKVRSRTMGMQSSEELQEVANLMFLEIQALDIPAWSCGYNILSPDKKVATNFMSNEGTIQKPFNLPLTEEASLIEFYRFLQSEESFFTQELDGKAIESHYNFMKSLPELTPIFEGIEQAGIALPSYQINHLCKFTHGYLLFITYEPVPDAHDIFKRFTKVFDQTYTRFLDIKKAEAQARESQLELSLERIRSQVTAMQESSDLLDIVVTMRKEFVGLGHEAHYFWYMRWLPAKYEKAMTSGDGTRIGMVMSLPRHIHGDVKLVADWEKSDEPTVVFAMDEETAVDYVHKMITLGDFKQVDPQAPTLDDIRNLGGITFIMARTTHGEIGFSLPGEVHHPPKDAVNTLARFAGVFDLAYKRFEDLKTAEKDIIEIKAARQKAEEALLELKATQSQLIQSEKMASLGELTAGIAHEIQNPLNFVNNFSEVSSDLIEEMKEELEEGSRHYAVGSKQSGEEKLELVKEIAMDIKQNLEKINHHGKRADAIVKGMLQHSRTSTGQKEPTDINALADEYLRLSYHGLRAKDKSFNADFKTDFDPNLPKINVISQDIGRVLLNLINNAFYACAERNKTLSGLGEYKPTVTVSTKNLGDRIEISVKDNGNGIPEEIKNKIFQPFFTTKPTGQGTGLGLSLSYDIVKAHGGTIDVESKENEGTAFKITLPA